MKTPEQAPLAWIGGMPRGGTLQARLYPVVQQEKALRACLDLRAIGVQDSFWEAGIREAWQLPLEAGLTPQSFGARAGLSWDVVTLHRLARDYLEDRGNRKFLRAQAYKAAASAGARGAQDLFAITGIDGTTWKAIFGKPFAAPKGRWRSRGLARLPDGSFVEMNRFALLRPWAWDKKNFPDSRLG